MHPIHPLDGVSQMKFYFSLKATKIIVMTPRAVQPFFNFWLYRNQRANVEKSHYKTWMKILSRKQRPLWYWPIYQFSRTTNISNVRYIACAMCNVHVRTACKYKWWCYYHSVYGMQKLIRGIPVHFVNRDELVMHIINFIITENSFISIRIE